MKKLKREGVENVKLILSENYENTVFQNNAKYILHYFLNRLFSATQRFLINIGRLTLQKLNFRAFKKYKYELKDRLSVKPQLRYLLIPKSWNVEYLKIQNWIDGNNIWANSLEQDLFHYRRSLTTVLNYISIKYPEKKILLVGVDLNSSKYFFEKELESLSIDTKDWTTKISKQHDKHFSLISYKNSSMADVLPFIKDKLNDSGNEIFSLNPQSYLVEINFATQIQIKN